MGGHKVRKTIHAINLTEAGTLIVAGMLVAACTLSAAAEPANPIVVKAARMFDGKSDGVVSPGIVVVVGGKIQAAGP